MLKYYDFHCSACDEIFDALVASEQRQEECPTCGEASERILSAARVGLYNDPSAQSAALRKRSYDHSMREAKKNAEQIASKMGGVAKAQSPWNIRSKKPKKSSS